MFTLLLVLNFITTVSFLFATKHKNILNCTLFAMFVFFLITLYEKSYYVAGMFLLEMFFLHKFTTIILVNEKPMPEEYRKEKRNVFPFLAICIFCALISGYSLLMSKDITVIDSLNLDFGTTEVYKAAILLICALTLFISLREIKK